MKNSISFSCGEDVQSLLEPAACYARRDRRIRTPAAKSSALSLSFDERECAEIFPFKYNRSSTTYDSGIDLATHDGRRFTKRSHYGTGNVGSCYGDSDGNQRQHDRV